MTIDPAAAMPYFAPMHHPANGIAPLTTASGGAAWPSANLALYFPFRIGSPMLVTRLWFAGNGTGNADVGIFDMTSGTKLVSTGAIANSAALVLTDVTDMLLLPGFYWCGMSLSSTSQIIAAAPAIGTLRAQGVCQEASAHPLPATATPITIAYAYLPLFGVSTIAADL